MNDNENPEELLRCRCSDCGVARQRSCNSTKLKELLGNLFDEISGEKFQGLYCRKDENVSLSEEAAGNNDCLCGECELIENDGRYFCKPAKATNSKSGTE